MPGYPMFTPPVHSSVLFYKDAGHQGTSQYIPHPVPKHPFGLDLSVQNQSCGQSDWVWPGLTQYQAVYIDHTVPQLPPPCPVPDTTACPTVPYPDEESRPDFGFDEDGPIPSMPPGYNLWDRTPPPMLDKRIRGCHYSVGHPLGANTSEERNKCKIALAGLSSEKITALTELDDVYAPNYRYKEWIERPMPELAREIDANMLFCRVSGIDTSHYDFYHQVRMGRRTSPRLRGEKFVTCAVVPQTDKLLSFPSGRLTSF